MENNIRLVVGILTTTGCKSIRYIDKFRCFWMFLTRIEFLQSSYAGDEWIIAYPTSQKPFMSRSNPKFWQENHWNLISNMNWCTCLNPKYASPFLHVGNISNHFFWQTNVYLFWWDKKVCTEETCERMQGTRQTNNNNMAVCCDPAMTAPRRCIGRGLWCRLLLPSHQSHPSATASLWPV